MSTAGEGGPEQQPAAPPSDPQALEQEIKRTREELGETVAALMAKTDMKARASEKAHELSSRLTSRARYAGGRLAGQASQARHQLAGQADQARHQLEGQAERGRTLLAAKSTAGGQFGQQAAQRAAATAAPARQAARRAVSTVRQHPVPAAVAAGVLLLAVLAAARGRRR